MKQHITKKQWDDISNNNKEFFRKKIGTWHGQGEYLPNIGQMIEFLGDDLIGFWRGEDMVGWEVDFKKETFKAKKLCDALWEAVKEKLKI